MRVLHIAEGDEALFGNELSPEHFKFYLQHRDAFQRMWKEQGTGFWLRFVISFRSFMMQWKKFGINVDDNEVLKKKVDRAREDVYCKILNDFTSTSCSALKTLMVNVATVAKNMHTVNIAQKSVVNDPFYSKISRSAFRDLFGDPTSKETFITMCDKLVIFLHAAGALCVLLKRWIACKQEVTNIINIPWDPPDSWNDISLFDIFECQLQRKFGENLFSVVGVKTGRNWTAKMALAEEEFKKNIVSQISSGSKKLLPWKPLDQEWTEKRLASTDICLHLTKLVWSTYWLWPSDLTSNCDYGTNVFWDNSREQCAIQISVAMYHHLFAPNFFAYLFKQINSLKSKLDDETLKELEQYIWCGRKCGLSKMKWKDLIYNHQVLEKVIPVFRNRTEEMLNIMDAKDYCTFPEFEKETYVTMAAWHLPLAKDYLDHALCWISYLEQLVAPLTIFPLLRELQQPLERLLIVLHHGKFCAQICMVYVDELECLYASGDFNWLSAVEYHETIQDLLSKLWLQDWLPAAVGSLEDIMNIAWSKQELRDGLTSSPIRQRLFAKFLNLQAYPSVETLFCDNSRHFAYWIPTTPELDKQKNNFNEVKAIWNDFCDKMKKGKYDSWNIKVKDWSSVNVKPTDEENIFIERMNWNPTGLQDFVDDVKEALTMIREDDYVSDDVYLKLDKWLKSLVLLNASNILSPVLDKMKENLELLHKHGCLYILGKSAIIAAMKIGTTEKAIFVSQLLQQCTKQVVVSSSKFVCLAQVIVTENETFVPCPSKKWHKEITSFLSDFSEHTQTGNLKLVNRKLEKLCKQFWDKKLLENDNEDSDNLTSELNSEDSDAYVKKLNSQKTDDVTCERKCEDVNQIKKISGVKKDIAEIKTLSKTAQICDGDNDHKKNNSHNVEDSLSRKTQEDASDEDWKDNSHHDIFFTKWEELFKKVVNNYYKLSLLYHQQGDAVSHRQFPHWHTLFFFMREEISYSGYFNFDEDDDRVIEEEFKKKLMDLRLLWMEKEIDKWCADSSLESGKQLESSLPADSAGLVQQHALARVRIIFSDTVIKACIVANLGVNANAFTNIRDNTIDTLNQWGFFVLNLVANDPAFWTDMPVLMVNFTEFLRTFANYTDTYRDHMLGMDGVSFYKKWDLDGCWMPDSVEHYRVAILALLRFNLLNFYVFLTMELPVLVNLHIDEFMELFDEIAKFLFCVTNDDSLCEVMLGGMSEARMKLYSLWQQTKQLQPLCKRDVQVLSQLPNSVTGSKSWKMLMENYVSGRYDAVTTKLALPTDKPGTTATNPAVKYLNKNKKQSPVKRENKCEVSVSMVQWDESLKDLVLRNVTICNSHEKKSSNSQDGCGDAGKGNSAKIKKGKTAKQERDPSDQFSTRTANGLSVPNSYGADSSVVNASNQCSKPDNEKTSADSSQVEMNDVKKVPSKVKALHSCAYCKSVEPSPRVYMKCALCKQHNFRPPMFYCGEDCHATHWKEGHGEQHAIFSADN